MTHDSKLRSVLVEEHHTEAGFTYCRRLQNIVTCLASSSRLLWRREYAYAACSAAQLNSSKTAHTFTNRAAEEDCYVREVVISEPRLGPPAGLEERPWCSCPESARELPRQSKIQAGEGPRRRMEANLVNPNNREGTRDPARVAPSRQRGSSAASPKGYFGSYSALLSSAADVEKDDPPSRRHSPRE